jgi:hypothetical protein
MTSAESIAKAAALTDGYGLPEDALELLRNEISWALDLSEARGRSNERAAVVAWLRDVARMHETNGSRLVASVMSRNTDAIERGDHRREEDK